MVFSAACALALLFDGAEKLSRLFTRRRSAAEKYFYVLRPLLAVRWVEAGKGVPPMRFAELLAGSELDAPLRAEIDELLERKQRAGEAEYGPRRPLLHAFIRAELARGEIPPLLPDSREGTLRNWIA